MTRRPSLDAYRQAFYGEKRRVVGSILRKLCEWKNVRILEAECCADHIHMLVEIPPKMSVSGFMGYLKGKSSLMLYEQFGDLKFKYRNSNCLWCYLNSDNDMLQLAVNRQ